MNKRLAILGHNTRGNEVIELLEMLGGVNGKIDNKTGEPYNVYNGRYFVSEICNVREVAYYIDFESQIRCIDIKDITTDFICYSFEMFLKTFPFKVGNFVRIPEYESEVRILKMKWCPVSKHIEYMVCPNDEEEWFTANELLEDNDDPNEMTDCKKCGLHFGSVQCFDKDCPNNTPKAVEKESIFTIGPVMMFDKVDDKLESEIIDGYEFDKIENGKIILKPIKFEYPKTYKECCDVLGVSPYYNLRYYTYEKGFDCFIPNDDIRCQLEDKLNTLGKLLICYNAYRKIAGEQMGLDKPWKPDLENEELYCIQNYNKQIIKSKTNTAFNKILIFPTEEMRDTFYENFKKEIEQCKELL